MTRVLGHFTTRPSSCLVTQRPSTNHGLKFHDFVFLRDFLVELLIRVDHADTLPRVITCLQIHTLQKVVQKHKYFVHLLEDFFLSMSYA